MDLHDLCSHLTEMLEVEKGSLYVRLEPTFLDFTADEEGSLVIENKFKRISFALKGELESVRLVASILESTVFNRDMVSRIYAWDIQHFITYVKHYIPDFSLPSISIIDLKVIEAFLGISKNQPKTYIEAVNRATTIQQNDKWVNVYKSVHLPLMLKVLPTIETTPLLDTTKRDWVYPYYEIEGQANGRLNATAKLKKGYLPHNMGKDVKEVLQPQEGYRFLSADFKSCEIFVLHWLSKDKELARIIESGLDLHSEIYRVVTQDEQINPTKRDLSKLMFLPVMYGRGPEGLAKGLSIPLEAAKELIRRIRKLFSGAFEWMMAQQEYAKQNLHIEDYFGRRREFPAEKAYLARNFVVQAVAATFCQEKLIDLFNSYKDLDAAVVFSVHDGYGVTFLQKLMREINKTTKAVLETESKMCPGLTIPADLKFGGKLSHMKRLE